MKVYEHVSGKRPPARSGPRSRSCPPGSRPRFPAHRAHSPVDGRGGRVRRAISVRRGRARLFRGHQPRHAKVYRNFRAEYDRLQRERVAAFREFRADVESAAYPEEKHLVPIAEGEFAAFVKALEK